MTTTHKRTDSRNKLEHMIDTLRQEIASGVRKAGDFLPSELEWCNQYKLSNFSVRKALDVLVAEGLIEKIPRVGTRVSVRPQTEAVTIRLGYYPTLRHNMQLFELTEQFHKVHPNIRIQPVEMGWPNSLNQNEAELLMESYDVMMMNLHHFDKLMNAACEVPDHAILDPLDPVEDVFSFLNAPFIRSNKQYAQPLVYSPIIMCYNKDHFRELSLTEPDSSWTWQDVSHAANRLSENRDRLGFYFHLPSVNRWPLFLLQNGVVFERREHEGYNLREPKFMESMKSLKEFIGLQRSLPPFIADGVRDECTLLLNQKVSMVLTTYDRLHVLGDASFAYDIAPIPYLKESRTLLHVISIGVSKKSKHKQAAQAFISHMLSYESQQKIRDHTLRIPALRQAATDDFSETGIYRNLPKHYTMYRDIIPTYRYYTDLNMPLNDLIVLYNELKFYWSGMDDLETVLRRVEEKLERSGNKSKIML